MVARGLSTLDELEMAERDETVTAASFDWSSLVLDPASLVDSGQYPPDTDLAGLPLPAPLDLAVPGSSGGTAGVRFCFPRPLSPPS
ncbi:hypothetical protein B0T21DRAFT_378622 [Apiosordaria backusii]|uniref:Uncharacterized protein n=1 Tax=Apiosordaria backusii TaxID=314023 RepID=A0AA39ZRV4_9PEZI|nr:hypothetical protein B0T21DRAFT_378622 [Apiosordaria backusii]